MGDKPLVAPAMLLAFSIFTQVTLGVLTLLLLVPISLAVVHQVFALVTLLSGVWLWHRLKYARN